LPELREGRTERRGDMPTNPHATFEGPTLIPLTSRPRVVVRKVNDVTVIDLTGSFNRDQLTQAFREQIEALLGRGAKKLVVNLSQVPYADSSGVGALLGAFKFIQAAGGKCKFFGAPPQVVHTLKTLNLHRIFELFQDETAALSSF
jgi:anti-sigma B factor antagonist